MQQCGGVGEYERFPSPAVGRLLADNDDTKSTLKSFSLEEAFSNILYSVVVQDMQGIRQSSTLFINLKRNYALQTQNNAATEEQCNAALRKK
ncbi:jg21401 [Pararge aegeria aegeria]|uniref:Jg21401 protein n=1 Tax=Pararge aegeria aegeria TaxID=348720 RepID=A0A8S4RZQ6_9NEOP|nr:jg21401 [Pararge aegeria aegeria]